ncbi:MAG: bifunctional phosphopantothenoylcysteine decarboxylase/phosphopantothenate--cysteine ligase CoaBC [Halobacteriovoraceae bacterium]|jgi:phosphopantothenoylcysteine decarboxylase / phosphopantothenate---cysteine ligase|nr:bifunctional phosphopantothenoylcysteine decarboxylase/phosphopantothenate--cysteine ligase CoaBC [Halobacteriovoraceae bacterium]
MKILLGVCGSIAAYKTYDLVRLLYKDGHQVKVILTTGAQKFIKPETFLYLGAQETYCAGDDFKPEKKITNVLHIDLKDWCDIFVIAPASANTLAKLAHGQCDDLLSSVFLSAEQKRKIIFPAMNTQMYQNTITQKNLQILSQLNQIFIHPPSCGELACGEVGDGKLPAIEAIADFVQCYHPQIKQKTILITTGSTIVPLDPVRYITNPASGKTGWELTKNYLSYGHKVILVYGHTANFPAMHLKQHPDLMLIKVQTTNEMASAVAKHFPESDVFISSAAVSDIEVKFQDKKIKKSDQKSSFDFSWSTDILKEMLQQKQQQLIIGFAAETNDLQENMQKKWQNKPVDLFIGNQVHNGSGSQQQGFGVDENEYFLLEKGKVSGPISLSKAELANTIRLFTEENYVNRLS